MEMKMYVVLCYLPLHFFYLPLHFVYFFAAAKVYSDYLGTLRKSILYAQKVQASENN